MDMRLAELIGQRLGSVIGEVHCFDGSFSETPNSVTLLFDERDPLRVSGDADGWRIRLDRTFPLPKQMEESGEIVLRDLSRASAVKDCIHQQLKLVWTLESPKGQAVGLRFDFGSNQKLMILNWGDEIIVGNTYPAGPDIETIVEVPLDH